MPLPFYLADLLTLPIEETAIVKLILGTLESGPQWPGTLATRTGLAEEKILAVVSELLARDLVTVVVPKGRPSISRMTPEMRRELELVMSQDEMLGKNPGNEAMATRTSLWNSFFAKVDSPVFSLALTSSGQELIRRLDTIGADVHPSTTAETKAS